MLKYFGIALTEKKPHCLCSSIFSVGEMAVFSGVPSKNTGAGDTTAFSAQDLSKTAAACLLEPNQQSFKSISQAEEVSRLLANILVRPHGR